MKKEYRTDVVIIGAGPVGLFAIFQAGMLSMRSLVIDTQDVIGGQCAVLYPEKPIYDIPAYPKVSGKELVHHLQEQAAPFKPEYLLGNKVQKVDQMEDKSYVLYLSNGSIVSCKVILIAAGCGAFTPNKPPISNLELFEDKSFFFKVENKSKFKNKKVAILGGGDSAVDWAMELSSIASKIFLIHRREKFRALPESMNKIKELSNKGLVEIVTPYNLSSIEGNKSGKMKSLSLTTLDGKTKSLDVNYALAFYGVKSNLGSISEWELEMDSNNKIIADPATMMSNKHGIYAIGDAASYPGKLKLILSGFAESAMACHHAYGIVFPGKKLNFSYSTNKGIPSI